MRYGRLTLGPGAGAPAISFHPRLTVIAGVGSLERDVLIGELVGALSGTRRQTILDVIDDDGRKLVIDRTGEEGSDCVVESSGDDLTSTFITDSGRVDLLAQIGLDVSTARRRTRLTAADIASASRGDAIVARLAERDQTRLWQYAEEVKLSDAILRKEAESIGADATDAAIIEKIEMRHRELEAAQLRHEFVRHHALFTGGSSAMGAVPVLLMTRFNPNMEVVGRVVAFAMVAVAALFTILAIITRRRMAVAAKAERRTLDEVGADSYIGFHIRRMNDLLEGQQNRERLARAAREHREATARWEELAGDVTIEWAFANAERIRAAARRLEERGDLGPDAPADLAAIDPAELAQTFVQRVADLRHVGPGGESMPLILDEPLRGCDLSVKQWMLELIGRSAGAPQVVYLTSDPDVAAWARNEARSGSLWIIEPTSEAAPEGALVA